MGGELKIHWENLDELFVSLNDIGQQSRTLMSYFTSTVCDGAGFDYPTCALAPIGDQLPHIASSFEKMHRAYARRWERLAEAVHGSVVKIADTDEEVAAAMAAPVNANVASIFDLFGGGPDGLASFDSVDEPLETPKDGKAQQKHPSRFDDAADAWDTARDVINAFASFLNRFGAGLAPLDERSLRDYVVYPLAANYEKIGANANACGHFADGMSVWAANFRTLGGKVDGAIEGLTGTSLTLHLDVYSVVMLAIGGVVRKGSAVYSAIASVSESIAVQVERVLETMGERLLKLSSRIGAKAVPFLGWASLAVDLAEHGLAIVQDLIDDILECKKLIDQCFDLVDEITAWAEVQADRLNAFHQVLDMIEQLPGVSADGGIADVNGGVRGIERALDDISEEFGGIKSPELDDLTGALEDLSGMQDDGGDDDSDGDVPEPDDDEVIMAPGPMLPPGQAPVPTGPMA